MFYLHQRSMGVIGVVVLRLRAPRILHPAPSMRFDAKYSR
jgi:hypothetical protein